MTSKHGSKKDKHNLLAKRKNSKDKITRNRNCNLKKFTYTAKSEEAKALGIPLVPQQSMSKTTSMMLLALLMVSIELKVSQESTPKIISVMFLVLLLMTMVVKVKAQCDALLLLKALLVVVVIIALIT